MNTFVVLELFGTSPVGDDIVCHITVDGPNKMDIDDACVSTIRCGDTLHSIPGYSVDPIQALLTALGFVSSMVKQYENDGVQWYLSPDKQNSHYSSDVWYETASAMFSSAQFHNSE